MTNTQFGHHIYDALLWDKEYVNINNGSFGLTPKIVSKKAQKYRDMQNLNPQKFFMGKYKRLVDKNTHSLAQYLGTQRENIVFTRSTTESLNTILRSFTLFAGDEILTNVNVYPATNRILEFVCGRVGARHSKVNLPIDAQSKSQIIEAFADAITPRTRIVILEDVGALTTIVNPIEPIVEICKQYDIAVLVDGAHGVGLTPRNLDELGVDWYVGCCHKWLGAERSVGFIWANDRVKKTLRPMSISTQYHEAFPYNFMWSGTGDYSAWFSVTDAIAFRQKYGEEEIYDYSHTLVMQASRMMAKHFGRTFTTPESLVGFMSLIELPERFHTKKISDTDIMEKLLQNKIVAKIETLNGRKYVRLSAYIYNELSDYQKFCDVIDTL